MKRKRSTKINSCAKKEDTFFYKKKKQDMGGTVEQLVLAAGLLETPRPALSTFVEVQWLAEVDEHQLAQHATTT